MTSAVAAMLACEKTAVSLPTVFNHCKRVKAVYNQ